MEVKIVTKIPEINTTPLEKIVVGTNKVQIEFDDVEEERWEITFCPFQAVEVTTFDCSNLELTESKDAIIDGVYHSYILEIIDSPLIKRLKEELATRDSEANFLENAHHYIFPFQENTVEIVAWDNYHLKKIE